MNDFGSVPLLFVLKEWEAHNLFSFLHGSPNVGVPFPQIQDERLQFKHILLISFKIHSGGVSRQGDGNGVSVPIFMRQTFHHSPGDLDLQECVNAEVSQVCSRPRALLMGKLVCNQEIQNMYCDCTG